jgi:hypothetical protein
MSYSGLNEFLKGIDRYGVQIKSNFEAVFSGGEFKDFKFFCQGVSVPGIKTANGEVFFRGRSFQVPIVSEQEHEFQMTVINDASGMTFNQFRTAAINDYLRRLQKDENGNPVDGKPKHPQNGRVLRGARNLTIKARSDFVNTSGMNIALYGVRINQVSNLDFSPTDNSMSIFTVNCYASYMDYAPWSKISGTSGPGTQTRSSNAVKIIS